MVFDQEQDSWPVPGLGPSSIGPDASAKQVHVNTVQIIVMRESSFVGNKLAAYNFTGKFVDQHFIQF
jgi:hypothetical protein